jgi:hypothetical protein
MDLQIRVTFCFFAPLLGLKAGLLKILSARSDAARRSFFVPPKSAK